VKNPHKPTIDEYKVCRVHWIDASFRSGWHDTDSINNVADNEADAMVESVGWLIKDEPDCIVLALSVTKYRAGDLLRIPRAYIKEMFVQDE
jgi:hypothetical protein